MPSTYMPALKNISKALQENVCSWCLMCGFPIDWLFIYFSRFEFSVKSLKPEIVHSSWNSLIVKSIMTSLLTLKKSKSFRQYNDQHLIITVEQGSPTLGSVCFWALSCSELGHRSGWRTQAHIPTCMSSRWGSVHAPFAHSCACQPLTLNQPISPPPPPVCKVERLGKSAVEDYR